MADLTGLNDDLRMLWKMFSSMTLLKLIPLELLEECSTELQVTFATMIVSFQDEYPVSRRYTHDFLKRLIEAREATDEDVDEAIYDLYISLLDASMSDEDSVYKTYYMDDCNTVTTKEAVHIISEGTTALVTWKAALVMCEWMLSNKTLFHDRSVLELGSGAGLLGMCAIKSLQLKSYIFTDKRTKELSVVMGNLEINKCAFKSHFDDAEEEQANADAGSILYTDPLATTELLDWTCFNHEIVKKLPADIVFASDVCYDSTIIPSLVGCLDVLLRAGPDRVAYVSTTVRNPETNNCFLEALENNNLKWEVQTLGKQLFFYEEETTVEILKITSS